jgi:hypothetical protein
MQRIDIADIDIIFLSYDEPNCEQHWLKVQHMVPWAQRVHGVKGSDAAHKAAAEVSSTERFVVIDGDNIPDPEFFNSTLEFEDPYWHKAVFRWRACNHVNGLMYGNGGISCWTRTFVQKMRTHEASDGSPETRVEFCFDPLYWPMHDCYSTTYPNGSPFHAWRAGFREGVKMCLDRGRRPTLSEFCDRVRGRNLDHLTIWHNVGRDVDHGAWCIAGARMGTYMTMLTNWDYQQVQDWSALDELWNTVEQHDPEAVAGRVAQDLATQLDLPITAMSASESAFFKHHYRSNWQNRGIMVREVDVTGLRHA